MRELRTLLSIGFAALLLVALNACGDDGGDETPVQDTAGGIDTDTGGGGGDVAPPADTASEDVPAATPSVVINEVYASPPETSTEEDWIELYNAGDATADVSGWILRDEEDAHAFVLPAGTTLEPGAFLVFDRDESGAGEGFDFGFGPADRARLFDAVGSPVDETGWIEGQIPDDQTWGRIPDGTGDFTTLTTPTRAAPNEAP